MALFQVEKISTSEASEFFQGFRLVDPKGSETLAQALTGAACFAVEDECGKSVFAVRKEGQKLWVCAAAGAGKHAVFDSLERGIFELAGEVGASSIGFQTARRGLVAKAKKAGYRVTGYIMEKAA